MEFCWRLAGPVGGGRRLACPAREIPCLRGSADQSRSVRSRSGRRAAYLSLPPTERSRARRTRGGSGGGGGGDRPCTEIVYRITASTVCLSSDILSGAEIAQRRPFAEAVTWELSQFPHHRNRGGPGTLRSFNDGSLGRGAGRSSVTRSHSEETQSRTGVSGFHPSANTGLCVFAGCAANKRQSCTKHKPSIL